MALKLKNIIRKLQNLRKQEYLKLKYSKSYAFVGYGNHSINNLYPVISYLRLPLKYIVVKSIKNAVLLSESIEKSTCINDFDVVLDDTDISGVFICTHPEQHYDLIKRGLIRNKNVFVEKPPCQSIKELIELIEIERASKGFCAVGMQKRFAPAIRLLKNTLKNDVISYNYQFLTGAYPEGDSILDLFIHPIDLICHLFGECKIASIQFSSKDSIFMHLKHKGGFIGNVELSTQYAWKTAEESLTINTEKGIYKLRNIDNLVFESKTKSFFNFPIEKLGIGYTDTRTYISRNNFIPILSNNQVYTSGFYDEINCFINANEKTKEKNKSPLSSMLMTYKLLDQIKQYRNV